MTPVRERKGIHYWKCDRGEAFHGTRDHGQRDASQVLRSAETFLADRLGSAAALTPSGAQGNHVAAFAQVGDEQWFARFEDGPEGDAYMEVESRLLLELRQRGIPVPVVHFCDATRHQVPFAVQLLECIGDPCLNDLFKEGQLDAGSTARAIGTWIACWQDIEPEGFGPMAVESVRRDGALRGLHPCYADYFLLNLERHLDVLVQGEFLDAREAEKIVRAVDNHRPLLDLERACLVHKDLAFWNILGTPDTIRAFIDWDDAIGGDPMDDLSLLACFHGPAVVSEAFAGYESVRTLPENHIQRFWMHLLRNMVVKAVIRLGAGYFETGGNLFLMTKGQDGGSFRRNTRRRLLTALEALEENRMALSYE